MYLHERVRSLKYAFLGIKIAWMEEANFRFEIVCAVIAIFLSWFLSVSRIEFMTLLLAIGLMLTAELLNTALEEFCDMVKAEHDPHVAKIKDLAAGAVFVAGWAAILVGLIIFIPRLL